MSVLRRALLVVFLVLSYAFPLYWLGSVSLQSIDLDPDGRYHVWPNTVTFAAYIGTYHDSRSIQISLITSAIASGAAVFFSLLALYAIEVDIISELKKRLILYSSIGLFFLPPITVYPGFRLWGDLFPSFTRLQSRPCWSVL